MSDDARSEYLESLGQRVRMWRLREGKSYFSMPTPLWDEAVEAARKYGLRQVARDLGVNREDLKRRMGLSPQVKTGMAGGAPVIDLPMAEAQFIELPGVAQALATPSQPVVAECAAADDAVDPAPAPTAEHSGDATVEVVAADGAKLTVRIPVASFNVANLIHNFRSRA